MPRQPREKFYAVSLSPKLTRPRTRMPHMALCLALLRPVLCYTHTYTQIPVHIPLPTPSCPQLPSKRCGKDGPAVYSTWDACFKAIDKFPGAKFKSFHTTAEACAFAFEIEAHDTPPPLRSGTKRKHTANAVEELLLQPQDASGAIHQLFTSEQSTPGASSSSSDPTLIPHLYPNPSWDASFKLAKTEKLFSEPEEFHRIHMSEFATLCEKPAETSEADIQTQNSDLSFQKTSKAQAQAPLSVETAAEDGIRKMLEYVDPDAAPNRPKSQTVKTGLVRRRQMFMARQRSIASSGRSSSIWFEQAESKRSKNGKSCIIFFDGASRGNPGPSGAGCVVYDTTEGAHKEVYRGKKFLGIQTNNVAEYSGLILALEFAKESDYKNLEVRGDSKLILEQMKGVWKVQAAGLKPLHAQASDIVKSFASVGYKHQPREDNAEADMLANQAIDELA